MSSSMMRGVRRSLVLLATGTIMTGTAIAAAAQTRPGAVVQPIDGAARLRDHLATLGNNPQSLDALIGAGRAALEIGDAAAALTFFGRADLVSPRHARVKAGMASALVHLGQPQAALSLFAEAVALGAPDAEIAADRGLAFDLSGDPRRAQQDYLAALRRRDEPELRRRMALSLAISGQRDAALRMIDAQLRRNDRAAWRTQAFILALTGDAAGAGRTAQSVMPAGGAQAMAPFFARLSALSPAQKAMAVHLGQFPSDGRTHGGGAPVDVSADPDAVALAMAGAPPAPASRTQATQPRPTASRRRPETPRDGRGGRDGRGARDSADPYGLRTNTRIVRRPEAPPVSREPERRPTEVAEVNTRWAGAPYPAQSQPPAPPPARPLPAPAGPSPTTPSPTSPPQQQGSATQAGTINTASIPASVPAQPSVQPSVGDPPATVVSLPASSLTQQQATVAPATEGDALRLPARSEPAPTAPSLADIAAVVNALPQERQARAPTVPAARRAEPVRTADARPAVTRPTRGQAAQPANPSRHWVQIAGGIERASLPREFARLRAMAPEQLARRTAFTAPSRSTSRLLVGPFASAREAQDFVNQLARHDVAAFAWTSAAGQEIERVAGR